MVFKDCVGLDQDTWNRGQGWVLWKSLLIFDTYVDKGSDEAWKTKQVIDMILDEYIINK